MIRDISSGPALPPGAETSAASDAIHGFNGWKRGLDVHVEVCRVGFIEVGSRGSFH
jgi:hypothetical protein